MSIEIKIISLKNPCSACSMKYSYIKQIIENIRKKFPHIIVHDLIFESADEAINSENIEIKLFPTVILNGKQFSAGIIPNKKELEKLIESIEKSSS